MLDWTPLAADPSVDHVHLLFLSQQLCADDVFVFVQRTASTTPFFLAHRELILHFILGEGSLTLPWILFSSDMTGMPPQWEKACRPDFIMRMCLHSAVPVHTCAICLEDKPTRESPSQLPCIHFICRACMPKTFRPWTVQEYAAMRDDAEMRRSRAGLTCPVCKHVFRNYALVPSESTGHALDDSQEYAMVEWTK